MRKILFLLALAVVFVFSACGNSNDTESSEQSLSSDISYETIDLHEIEQHVNDGYTVVDVREIDEYVSGHLPNAINVPLSGIENGEFGPLNSAEKYIIICRSGNRSKVASEILSDAGYDVVNVSEGMSSWTGEIEKN